MLQTVGWIISIGFGFLGVVCWFGIVFFGIRAYSLKKPEASLFSLNLFDESGLSEAGVRALKKGRVCVLGFLLCWVLAVSIGIITGAFK